MGCTELTLIPIAEAMAAPRPMGYRAGRTTLGNLGSKDGMSDGLVFSRHSAAAPSTPNRSCQPDAGLGLAGLPDDLGGCPAHRLSGTCDLRPPQTCYCGLLPMRPPHPAS
jgi:hypothetical protein